MGNINDRFDVNISSETKLKDKNILTFEFKLLSDANCRIKVETCQVYDCDGYMYQATGKSISSDDFILGKNSKFFTELKRVNITISKNFKSRIGCNMVFTVIDVDEKKRMNLCFQKRSSTKWTFVGVQPLEYKEMELVIEDLTDDLNNEIENNSNDDVLSLKTSEQENEITEEKEDVLERQSSDNIINTAEKSTDANTESQMTATEQEHVTVSESSQNSENIKKETYVPSFARRYTTNYSAGSVAGSIKKVIKETVETPVVEKLEEKSEEEQNLQEMDVIKTENVLETVKEEEVLPAQQDIKQEETEEIPVYYRRKDSIELFRQRIADDNANMFLGMTLGAVMDKYELDNQRLETFLNVFSDRYKIADKSINEIELREKIEAEVKEKYKEELRAELKEELLKEIEEEQAAAQEEEEEDDDSEFNGLEFYDIEPERVEEYLNSIIEYDEEAASQIGLALDQTRVSIEEENGVYTATLYSEASYTKETYVLVRCPIVKVIFYDMKGNIANMAMHSVSRIYTGHDIIQMKLKSAKFNYWQNVGKLKIMVTL